MAAHTKPLSESCLAREELAAAFQEAVQGMASPPPKVNSYQTFVFPEPDPLKNVPDANLIPPDD